MRKRIALTIIAAVLAIAPGIAATAQLKFVVIISRHGVRAPTWDSARLNEYSTQPWPDWGVPPGNLTPHGVRLMTIMGSYYRSWLSSEGISLSCGAPGRVYVWADVDQRTLDTGRALARGIAPDCPPQVHAQADGAKDPLFDPIAAGLVTPDPERAAQAVRERIGPHPADLAGAHRAAFEALRELLAPGGRAAAKTIAPPALVSVAVGPRGIELNEPFGTASTFTENFLLEYANGMTGKDLGWGRLNADTLLRVMQLHATYADLTRRTPYIARARGSNLLVHVLQSMAQAVAGTPVENALGAPEDAVLVLSGHDTNQSNLSGMLGLSWHLPGYQPDDTPPGGALVFSLWQDPATRQYSVTADYIAQTLDQMRELRALTSSAPPAKQRVAIPGCEAAGAGGSAGCSWTSFERIVEHAVAVR